MKIAITGTTGFIGSYLAIFFAKKGWEVVAFGRRENTDKFHKYKNIKYISWNINSKLKNIDVLENTDVFIHSAANLNYEKSKENLLKDNVLSLDNIIEATININQFIYISSSSVYQGLSGILKVDEIIEEKNLANSYSLSKYLAENYLKNKKPYNITILRPRAVYGEGDNVLVPNILKNQFRGKLLLPGNGKIKTSITDINDLVEKTYKIITEKRTGIYNISTSVETYENLYKDIVKKNNLKGIIKIPIGVFKFLSNFNKNKYSYIVDTFGNDKILENNLSENKIKI